MLLVEAFAVIGEFADAHAVAEAEPLPGAGEAVRAVRAAGIPVAVASSSITTVSPGAFSPARSTADFTCADATGKAVVVSVAVPGQRSFASSVLSGAAEAKMSTGAPFRICVSSVLRVTSALRMGRDWLRRRIGSRGSVRLHAAGWRRARRDCVRAVPPWLPPFCSVRRTGG